MGENSFKKYNNDKFQGPVLASAFQVIATGVFYNITDILNLEKRNDWLKDKIQNVYSEDTFISNTVPGVRAIPRYKDLSEFGIKYFKP